MKRDWCCLSAAEQALLRAALCLYDRVISGQQLIDGVLAAQLDGIAKVPGQEFMTWQERKAFMNRMSRPEMNQCGLPQPVCEDHLSQAARLHDHFQARYGDDLFEALSSAVQDTMDGFGSSLMNGESVVHVIGWLLAQGWTTDELDRLEVCSD